MKSNRTKWLTALVAIISAAGVAVAAATNMVGATAQEADAQAEALVSDWIAAIGGMDDYRRFTSARYALTTEMYDAETARLRRTRPRYVRIRRTDLGELTRIERWEGDDFIAQGWDGRTEWATRNGEPLAAGDMDYDQVRYVSGDVNYWISLPYKLRDPGVNLHYRGLDEGKHLVGVTFGEGVGLHDGDAWQYWFEDGKSWPVQVAYREEGRTNWTKLRFEDIRTVDGYVFVGRRVHIDDDGRIWKVLRVSDFEFNADVSAEEFAPPQ